MDKNHPESLAKQVVANPKYQAINPSLVLRLSQEAVDKGLVGKPAVKYVRNKLHQVAGAYFKQKINYPSAKASLTRLPEDRNSHQVKDYCQKWMGAHTSTGERLPILEDFFQTCLSAIAPINSVLDLACGLNPLAIPWMPLAHNVRYDACDIYLDMLDLIDSFFKHINLLGHTHPCDLVSSIPSNTLEETQKAHVAFLLKSIPCLEQMDKSVAGRLLEDIPAEHILVSFPVHSLGGRPKGMKHYYWEHFQDIVTGNNWQVKEFIFTSELAFLVSK